jgi:hypothetical protein
MIQAVAHSDIQLNIPHCFSCCGVVTAAAAGAVGAQQGWQQQAYCIYGIAGIQLASPEGAPACICAQAGAVL